MSVLKRIVYRMTRWIAACLSRFRKTRFRKTKKSRAVEILRDMGHSASKFDVEAFSVGADRLMDDSVMLLYNAKLTAMTRHRRRYMKAMSDDEASAWLYDMSIDSMSDMPPLKVRMILSAACARHAQNR